MSNNPLEAVTQADNSLVTALELPDESAKPKEIRAPTCLPHFDPLV
ncbi:F pilus assembly Type-IV secretion system for plasmid transfer family protein, partial [Klebsiella pneumoniae]